LWAPFKRRYAYFGSDNPLFDDTFDSDTYTLTLLGRF